MRRQVGGFLILFGAIIHNGGMELLSVFQFIWKHNEMIIGVLIALILLTGILFLWRMINEQAQEGGGTTLDVEALEGTLKRVLSQTQIATVAVPAGGGGDALAAAVAGGDSAAPGKLEALVAEREKRIAELQAALEEAKAHASAAAASSPGNADSAIASLELQNKVRELEARLAEYAIIEDDIADLSMYKDENQRLKTELEDLRSKMASGGGAPASSSAIPETPMMQAPAFEKAEKFGLDADDDVMKEFAAAVNGQSAPKTEAATEIQMPSAPALPDIGAEIDLAEVGGGKDAAADAQAAIDKMFAAGLVSAETLEKAGETVSTPTPDNAQAAIDAMFATAKSEGTAEPAKEESGEIDDMLNAAAKGAPAWPEPMTAPAAEAPAPSEDADPLSGALDTSKMMEEVASLQNAEENEGDALEDTLDTDKLLLEVNALGSSPDDPTPGEDLFGEFKDEEKK